MSKLKNLVLYLFLFCCRGKAHEMSEEPLFKKKKKQRAVRQRKDSSEEEDLPGSDPEAEETATDAASTSYVNLHVGFIRQTGIPL